MVCVCKDTKKIPRHEEYVAKHTIYLRWPSCSVHLTVIAFVNVLAQLQQQKFFFENNLHTYILYVYLLTIRNLRNVCCPFEHTLTYTPTKLHGRVTAKTVVSV